MTNLSSAELQKYLAEILACDAFELHADGENIYIPYMMNDALECYLHFSGAQLTGRYLPDFEGETSFELIENNAKPAVIFRQSSENVFTLWFSSCCRVLNCYRCDRIGHFWVKGQEHWRRLVYIVGTIYDKYEYMGEQVCNEKEIALLPLMEFAPFRMYSPIHGDMESTGSMESTSSAKSARPDPDPLGGIYSDSPRGLETIKTLAEEVGDRGFLLLLCLYRAFHFQWMKKILHRAMNRPARIPLYESIFEKVRDAVGAYPERDYGDDRNQQIRRMRKKVTADLGAQGFSGTYPLFQKGNRQILAMEEHPFTILEASDFEFRIQLMESEVPDGDTRINAGFFKKRGNRGRISAV